MSESIDSAPEPQTTEAQSEATSEPDYRIKEGCLEAQLNSGQCVLIKVDNSCSCPTDLSKSFTQADALKLSRLLHNIGSAKIQPTE